MKRYPKELKQKVVAALFELDNSGDATPGAIAKIARDHGINANVSLPVELKSARLVQIQPAIRSTRSKLLLIQLRCMNTN